MMHVRGGGLVGGNKEFFYPQIKVSNSSLFLFVFHCGFTHPSLPLAITASVGNSCRIMFPW